MDSSARTEVSLFGPLKLIQNGAPTPLKCCGRTLDLLRFLLVHGNRSTRREAIADAFWPRAHPERRRSSLNSAVWRIRSAIAPVTGLDLVSEGDTLMLRCSEAVRIDAFALEAAYYRACRTKTPDEATMAALTLELAGSDEPFLDGCSEAWAIVERERLAELRLRGMGLLMSYFGMTGQYDDAVGYGKRILAEDPFRESVHCAVMWLYYLSGRRAEAIRQYQTCVDLLDRELGIEPMAELKAIRDYIGGAKSDRHFADDADWRRYESALTETRAPLQCFLESVEQSRLAVFSAICAKLQ